MKKLTLISLCILSHCNAADEEPPTKKRRISDQYQQTSWDYAVQAFQPIQGKQQLELDNKNITEIPKRLNLPRLKVLDLSNNQITAIPPHLSLLQLERLLLESNLITAIPENLNLPQLKVLDLSNNQITHVNPNTIEQFPELEYLLLNDNPITQEEVDLLKQELTKKGLEIEIIADFIGAEYDKGAEHRLGATIKGAKYKKRPYAQARKI